MQLDVSTSDEEKLIYVKKHGRAFTARAQGKQGFHRGDAEARRKSRKDWPRTKRESLESQAVPFFLPSSEGMGQPALFPAFSFLNSCKGARTAKVAEELPFDATQL